MISRCSSTKATCCATLAISGAGFERCHSSSDRNSSKFLGDNDHADIIAAACDLFVDAACLPPPGEPTWRDFRNSWMLKMRFGTRASQSGLDSAVRGSFTLTCLDWQL